MHCEGYVAADAAKYPEQLCVAILRGMKRQLLKDGRMTLGCFGVHGKEDKLEELATPQTPERGYSGKYRDDVTGQVLKDELVLQARQKELDYFNAKGVWSKKPFGEARRRTGRPPITVRRVDVNKGDELTPNYRSRLVARQLKARDPSAESFFAPTPPLEALRTVLSMTATTIGEHKPNWDPDSPQRTQLSCLDVARAYFNAKCDPENPTYVQLPSEDPDSGSSCGLLLRHMYGTRRAADGWQEECSTSLVEMGFVQGEACPNLFRHELRGILCSVHGDDFTSSGPADALDWMEEEVQKRYEVTLQPRLGPGPHDAKEVRVLNRIIRWKDDRIEYEADPRQVEKLLLDCGLEGANTAATPGVRANFEAMERDAELPTRLHTAFRGAAARGNYLAADRLDCQFSCKEVSRYMAKPSQLAWEGLKRMCRYLAGLPRLVYHYPRQVADHVEVFIDTDWAGCPKTRRSTTGGRILIGSHTIKHWSSTQTSVTLPSGEAEFHGVVKACGMGLGYQSLLRDFGLTLPIRVWTDSSAAIGVSSRQGLGKLRHVDTHLLWVQQAVRQKRLELRKVAGTANPADVFTKYPASREKLRELTKMFGCHFEGGRAESAPKLRRDRGTKTVLADEHDTLHDPWQDGGGIHGVDDGDVVMPHLAYDGAQMDERHPPLEAEPEGDVHFEPVLPDNLLVKGLRIVEQIREETRLHGRTARVVQRGLQLTGLISSVLYNQNQASHDVAVVD